MTTILVGAVAVSVVALTGWTLWAHAHAGGVRRGLAPGFAVLSTMSATAMRRKALRTRPSTHVLPWTPAREVGIELGRRRRRTCYASMEDVVLVVGVPRSMKTGLLICHVQDAPGAVMAFSTKTDLHDLSHEHRDGPIWVFNPEQIGGVTSTLRWSPIDGCADPATAIQRAGYLVTASAKGGVSDGDWWEGNAHRVLRCLLAAADLAGEDMHAVTRWASDLTDPRPVTILQADKRAPAGWAAELRRLQAMPDRTRDSISITLTSTLQFMSNPRLAEAATPPPGEGFDVQAFLERRGTCYLISSNREHDPVAPLFAAFAGYVHDTAKTLSQTQRGGRLDPPLMFVADEAPNTCRLPWDRLSADTGGRGIPAVISIQSPSQLHATWGEHGGKTIWNNAAVKVMFGGLQDADHLERMSKLCGTRATTVGSTDRLPVLTVDDLRELDDNVALVLRRNTRAVLVRVTPAWARRHSVVNTVWTWLSTRRHPASTTAHDNVIPMPGRTVEDNP